MWEIAKQFIIDNQATIIISLVIGAIFFILGPLGLWFSGKKVKNEKTLKAKTEFLDLIESMLVNKESINKSKLLTLFRAVERQNGISLELDSDIQNLLEDLALRFAKSKHLSPEQKDEYSNEIDSLISSLNEPKKEEPRPNSLLIRDRELPKSLKSIVTDLKKEAEEIDSERLREKIVQLEKYYSRPNDPFLTIVRIIREKPQLFLMTMLVYVIIIVVIAIFVP